MSREIQLIPEGGDDVVIRDFPGASGRYLRVYASKDNRNVIQCQSKDNIKTRHSHNADVPAALTVFLTANCRPCTGRIQHLQRLLATIRPVSSEIRWQYTSSLFFSIFDSAFAFAALHIRLKISNLLP